MTDRIIRTLDQLDRVDFAKGGGLVPVIVQDAGSGGVLMMAWANREALEATLTSGEAHFWSRSRGELWRKGHTSGNTLAVRSLHADCDGDAVLALVDAAGPACHTGERTCFGAHGAPSGAAVPASAADPAAGEPKDTLSRLDRTLAARAAERPAGSYTVRLLDDANLRFKKLGEETAELVAALATGDAATATDEAADVVYHVLVALRALGVGAAELCDELERRAR